MNDLFGVSDYTVSDLVFYAGLFGGVIVAHLTLAGTIENSWIRLGIGVVLGIGLGWGLRLLYSTLAQRSGEDS